MNEAIPNPFPVLDLEPPQVLDIAGKNVDDDIDDDEKHLRRARYQPRYPNAPVAPAFAGPTATEQEMIRHLVRMIRLFLLGKNVDEIEAEMSETRVETAERSNVSIHANAVNRLRDIANDLDPDKDLSSTKTTARDNISEAMKRISATSLATQAKFKPR